MAQKTTLTNDNSINRLQGYSTRLQSILLDLADVDIASDYSRRETAGSESSAFNGGPWGLEGFIDSTFYDNIRAKLTDIITDITSVKDRLSVPTLIVFIDDVIKKLI